MAAVSMENRLSDSEPLANATPPSSDKGKLLPNSSKAKSSSTKSSSKTSSKEVKRGKLSKALTLPADACSPPISNQTENKCLRPIQILPRTSQYEKHPLLQERSASGLSELEQFLLERDIPSSKPVHRTEQVQNQCDPSGPVKPTLKLQPRGAQYERHALLVKTSSGKSELEQLLLEKEKELEKKEKKSQKLVKSTADILPLKRLWIKKGVSVEKAKSFEKTACLEKAKSIDLSQNVSRARSLEEESSLEKVRLTKKHKTMEKSPHHQACVERVNSADHSQNPGCSSSEQTSSANQTEMTNTITTSEGCPDPGAPSAISNVEMNSTTTDTEQTKQDTKRRLLDLALKPNLEWREDDQQFVFFVESPVSPLVEKPDNLLICYEPWTNSIHEGQATGEDKANSSFCNKEGGAKLSQLPPFEKPKKYVHPTVIDSDPDSEGMVCMDELESIDFGASSPEPSPRKSPAKALEKDNVEQEPLLTEKDTDPIKPENTECNSQEERAIVNPPVPVDVMSDIERKRKLSLKRASLGQLEPRTEQYVQHPLLEEKDEEGQSAIEKLLHEKVHEKESLSLKDKDTGELAVDVDQKHQPKASIKRVHFEKSDGGPEIEELGKVDIEADPASTNSTRSNSAKKKGFRGSKNNKNKDDAPEEEKLLDGEGEDNDKDNKTDGGKNKCCCIS